MVLFVQSRNRFKHVFIENSGVPNEMFQYILHIFCPFCWGAVNMHGFNRDNHYC